MKAMIDARIGQADPCPMCGSADVRWRGRRWYDVPLTWVRFIVVGPIEFVFAPKKRSFGGIGHTGEDLTYDAAREAYDDRMATATARRFWKCRACRNKGQVFADVGAEQLEHLESIEDALAENKGGVERPVGRRHD
jgi:hypothetical protein